MPAWFNKQPFALITPKVMDWWKIYAPEHSEHQFELPAGVPWNNWGITYQQQFPVMEPGKLWWPTGASRFGVYTGIADKRTVDLWKTQIEGTYANRAHRFKGMFRMQDTGQAEYLEVPMFMLPPRPITFSFGSKPMYLVTLVDKRYFWWYVNSGDLATEPLTTWKELFQFIRSKVNEGVGSFRFDKPHDDYHSPGELIAKASHIPLPILLDAAAWSVGCRVVMQFDDLGSCKIMGLDESITNRATGMKHKRALAGGYYDMRRQAGATDKRDAILFLPKKVVVSFPKYNDYMELEGRTGIVVNTIDLPMFTGYEFFDEKSSNFPIQGELVVYDTAQSFTAKDNEKELTALAKKIAADLLAHEAESVIETTLVGVQYVNPSGLYDFIEVTERIYLDRIETTDEVSGAVSVDTLERVIATTKVARQPWMWRPFTLHHAVGGSSSSRAPRVFQWVIDCGTGTINVTTGTTGDTGRKTQTTSSDGSILR